MTDSPLSRAEIEQGLAYWLAAIRLEETLKVRPRARRTRHESATPELAQPASGQEYFKLPFDAALSALVTGSEGLTRAFDGELCAFFEGWLTRQYRRREDDGELAHLLCFPVVHLPRGELAGLLRAPIKLRFADDAGGQFRVPTRSERQRAQFPAAPRSARLERPAVPEDGWPFFIDTRLLAHPLGVASEDIDALFEAMRARRGLREAEQLALVADTLERTAQLGPEPHAEPLARLTRAVQALLAQSSARAEVYPVGIVIDATQSKTTWHLQREITALLDDGWPTGSPLDIYLGGRAVRRAEAPQRALPEGAPLTPHQRSAAERFWGSTLSAVQGPPGTGKTTLIRALCAEALVRQVDTLLEKQVMGKELFLIASSNNRAVDNVMEAFAGELPLALRVGNRQQTEQVLVPTLQRTLHWLARAQEEPPASRTRALEEACARYAGTRAELDALLAPRVLALRAHDERSALTEALAALPAPGTPALAPAQALALHAALHKVEARLEALSKLCAKAPSMAHVNAVARHYERTAERDLPALEALLTAQALRLDVPLPPLDTPLDVSALLEAWEDGAERFLARLADLRTQVDGALHADRVSRERASLVQKLAALPEEGHVPPAAHDDDLSRRLFRDALAVREAWARANGSELSRALQTALAIVEEERSLRPLFRDQPKAAAALCRLFGVWGSTLLSLGNCLPAEPGSVASVVIDEAGQCHPAHAVSALLRAHSALLIGDVHQLAPVFDLSVDDEARLAKAQRAPSAFRLDDTQSAQALADRATEDRPTLIDHFRCQPEIIAVSDALCGYGLIAHAPAVDDASRRSLLPHPLLLVDVRGEQDRASGSLFNARELDVTLRLVETLLARGVTPSDLAVITPYRGQLDRLRRALYERRVPLEFSPELAEEGGYSPGSQRGLALGTVHRLQGGERSVVLFTSVVSQGTSLPFLNARPNLLNVAVSRAQQHFVCIGHAEVLARGARTRILVERAHPFAW